MGLNIARDLIAAGAHVAMVDLKPAPQGLDGGPGEATYCQGDVTDERFIAGAMAQAFDAQGRLDFLVNAAGVLWFGRDTSLTEIDLDLWDRVLAINLKSVVHTVRHAVPLMKQTGGGAMVHFSTVQCLRGDDKPQDAYQASKAGIMALSKSIAVQFGRDRIRSNVILPGATESPMQDRWTDNPEITAAVERRAPLGRVGATQDMADACLFLLSDKASYITGTELIVDGGVTALP